MPQWVWNGIAETIIGLAITTTVEILNTKYPGWREHTTNVIRNTAFVLIVFYVVTGRPIFDRSPAHITPDNVEAQTKDWLRQSGFGPVDVPKVDDDAVWEYHFAVDIHWPAVKRLRANDGMRLQVWTQTQPTTDQIMKMRKLPAAQQARLEEDMKIQISKLDLDYEKDQKLLDQWTIKGYVRIQDGMEGEFLETTQRVNRAALALEQTIEREVNPVELAGGR